MADLSEKVALVSGGSRGIGAGIARRLASDGAHVVITFRDQSDSAKAVLDDIKSHGRKGVAIQADAANATEFRPIIDQVIEQFGRIDILVNNVGFIDTMACLWPTFPWILSIEPSWSTSAPVSYSNRLPPRISVMEAGSSTSVAALENGSPERD